MNPFLKAFSTAFFLCLTLTVATIAAPPILTNAEMAGVTGQKGIHTDAMRHDNPQNETTPPLQNLRQLQILEQTQNRDRALAEATHVAHDFVTIHTSLFVAPEAVTTILAAPTTLVGGFFF